MVSSNGKFCSDSNAKMYFKSRLLIKLKRDNMTNSDKVYGFNTPQRLFVGYTLAVLVDLVVLNFFDEYWDFVNIESFTISLIAALLLQLLSLIHI